MGGQGIANFVAQLLGSFVGAVLLALVKDHSLDKTGGLGTNTLAPGIGSGQALVGEIICTFFLMYTVLETAVSPKSEANRALAPLAIGLAVYLGHSFLIPVDGCSINPTRTIGPAIVATFRVDDAGPIWSAMWVFWVGPCVGALLAVFVYEKAYAALPGAAAPSAAAAPPQQEARTEPTAA